MSIHTGCRETAFVYAITSAALSHSIAQGCSDGSIYTCSCGAKDRYVDSAIDWLVGWLVG